MNRQFAIPNSRISNLASGWDSRAVTIKVMHFDWLVGLRVATTHITSFFCLSVPPNFITTHPPQLSIPLLFISFVSECLLPESYVSEYRMPKRMADDGTWTISHALTSTDDVIVRCQSRGVRRMNYKENSGYDCKDIENIPPPTTPRKKDVSKTTGAKYLCVMDCWW